MEYGLKDRVLRLLMCIMEAPFVYSKRALAERYGVSLHSIEDDFAAIKNAGFVLDHDDQYRYKLVENRPALQLKELLHFSEEEQLLLEEAIDFIGEEYKPKAQELKKKLNALYDFGRLGHSYLRKPYLSKLDLLEEAQQDKKQLLLKAYRSSNSNLVKDRRIEAFYYHAADDMIQAFDIEQKSLRHFRISRVGKMEVLEESWQYEQAHQVLATDPFRVLNNEQVEVVLHLPVGAYNELIERFPLCKNYVSYQAKADDYVFKALVNAHFYGLINFILSQHHQAITIVKPSSLVEALQQASKQIYERWKTDKAE